MTDLLSIGYHKGEMDFGVNGEVANLSQVEMSDFRKMVCVAIGIAEDMWRRAKRGEQIGQVETKRGA